jgi:signal transduction histidine kinase
MSDVRDTTAEARAHTDASLVAERASTDAATERSAARMQRALDDQIERDRIIADARLLKFRDRADGILSESRSRSSSTESSIRMERLVADDGKMHERAVVDGLLEGERQRADAAVEVERREREAHDLRHDAHRRATDEQLSTERTEADDVVIGLGAATDELAKVQSEQARRGDVLGVVAHELRNPLGVISLNAEVLAERVEDPSLREAAQDVMRAAARMARLIADLLDVTRIQAGELAIYKSEHDVSALLSEVHRTYEPLFAARGVDFTVDLPPVATVAMFDHDRIVQVLSNLLGNAMKFTPAKGLVRLRVDPRESSQIELVLTDSGPGIRK